MKAARLYGHRDVRVEEVPLPDMAPHQVRIAVMACGVCPSDLGRYVTPGSSGDPFIPGHEWAGEIVEVGSEVTSDRIGDRVAAHLQVVCGMCENCQRGILNKCTNRHGEIEGGFSEYGRVSAKGLLHIPEGLSYEEASFIEPLAACINGTWRSNIRLGDDVVVVGVGPIGLLHVQLARLQGARVIATDLIQERLEVASQLGAHDVVDASGGDSAEQVQELTGGRGADAIIVAAGAQAAMEEGLQMAAVHGNVNLFATGHPAPRFAVDSHLIHMKEVTLTGSNHFSPFTFQRALKLLQYGLVQVQPLISHRLPLERIQEAFDTVADRKGLKVIVFPQPQLGSETHAAG